jgi:alcohol dehydrogenase
MKYIYYRFVQWLMYGLSFIIRIPKPIIISGQGRIVDAAPFLNKADIKKVLIVTDQFIHQSGLMNPLLDAFKQMSIDVVIYADVLPDPTITQLETAKDIYRNQHCQAIIGIGGGSSLDCAKGAAALIATGKTVPQLKGLLKVRLAPPFMVMIPTTAGTGSEATVAVVVSNPDTKEKYAISDPILVPKLAILDPQLTVSLPKHLTAYTGIDALTHALEAHLNLYQSRFVKKAIREAFIGIHQHLVQSYLQPDDLIHRQGMLDASIQAGMAFTRSYVGYIHGIAHTLGGFYHVPHGLANAIVLPKIIELYGPRIDQKLAIIADWLSLAQPTSPVKEKADATRLYVKELFKILNVPDRLSFSIQETDIPLMLERVRREVYPFYPVPVFLSKKQLQSVYTAIQGVL